MASSQCPAPPPIARESHVNAANISRNERWLICIAATLLVGLRFLYPWSLIWDSDEPQHLHVVWSWVVGLLPYRDVFDNHTPLFSLLCAPVLALVGERPDPIAPMRLAMLPLWGVSMWCVCRIGTRCFSRRAGIWAAIFSNLLPNFYFLMAEFRTDVLWTTLWLATIAILLDGSLSPRRLFFAGLTLGAAFSVSMKTTLFLLTLLSAGAGVWLAYVRSSRVFAATSARSILAGVVATTLGLLLIPAAFVGWFTAHGAATAMWYCVIEHNVIPGETTTAILLHRLWSQGAVVFLAVALAFALVKRPAAIEQELFLRRLFLALTALLFFPLLHGLWPIITPQDHAPWIPVLVLILTPVLLASFDWVSGRFFTPSLRTVLPGALVVAGILWLTHRHHPFSWRNKKAARLIAQGLALTRPDEYVMDAKGELVFRQRAFYYALETLTKRRIGMGLIPDDINERLIATRTTVLHESGRLTRRTRTFTHENYLNLGELCVLGKRLQIPRAGPVSFEIAIPQTYSLISAKGALAGTLDGTPISGPRALAAGSHTVEPAVPVDEIAIIWTRAIEQGYTPFPTAH